MIHLSNMGFNEQMLLFSDHRFVICLKWWLAPMPLKVLYTTWVWDVSIFFRQLHLSSIDQPFLRQTLAGAEKTINQELFNEPISQNLSIIKCRLSIYLFCFIKSRHEMITSCLFNKFLSSQIGFCHTICQIL